MTSPINAAIEIIKLRKPEIVLGPRPGKKSLANLQELNLTHCCTLLSEREEAPLIARIAMKIPCEWVWLPIEGGHLETLSSTDIEGLIITLSNAIADTESPRLYLHCSAGIHRTGFFAYMLLRLMGMDKEEATSKLVDLRSVTAAQVGDERLALAEDLLADLLS